MVTKNIHALTHNQRDLLSKSEMYLKGPGNISGMVTVRCCFINKIYVLSWLAREKKFTLKIKNKLVLALFS